MDDAATTSRVRVLIAEDNADLAATLAMLVDADSRLQYAGHSSTLSQLEQSCAAGGIDVVVLDLQLGRESALKALPALCARHAAIRFLVHTGHNSPELASRARVAGAAGFVVKAGDPDRLLAAIHQVATRAIG
jgi:DNA-binding NarL/FixJ family response regulator